MKYKNNWEETKVKWNNYWKRENTGRPLMCVIARKPEIEEVYQQKKDSGIQVYSPICQGADYSLPKELMYGDNMEDKYQNAERMVARYRHFCETHEFLGESFPNINVDFGPGSLAGYVGSDIKFSEDTVWFEKCVDEWDSFPKIQFDSENKWWKKHYQLVKDIRRLAGDDFYVGMPDLMENIDVLASLRGTQDMIFDMVDEPEVVTERIKQVSDCYFDYYDRFYDLIKNDQDGGSAYTVFQIWGTGKTAKLQCDFGAMMSPDNYRDFILEPLRAQAKKLDHVLYHLDGPDCIRHMDAIMEIDEIDALQWTSGDYGPDGTLEDWYQIYDKARKAGKGLWVKVYSGEFEDWLKNVDRIVARYGSHCLFLMFPEMSLDEANRLLEHADKYWSDVEGTFHA
jgi:hypothetical protein